MSGSPAELRQELSDQIPPLKKEAAHLLGLILDRAQMIEDVDAKMEGREERFVHLEFGFDVSDIRVAYGWNQSYLSRPPGSSPYSPTFPQAALRLQSSPLGHSQ